jgi:predicted dehydrogenase
MMVPMKGLVVDLVAGARPNFVKLAPVKHVQAMMIGRVPGVVVRDDKVTFTLTFEDGSFGTVHYLANGHRSFPKERLEVFAGGRILQLDNFRRLRAYGWLGFKGMRRWRQDKGNRSCAAAFVAAVRDGGPSPIPFEQLLEVTRVTFAVVDAANSRGERRLSHNTAQREK